MLMHRSFWWQPSYSPTEPPTACKGAPLVVDYNYRGGDLSPHACAVQCEQPGEQRYIVYADGYATQCQLLPGCLDEGEDNGVTCIR